MTPHSNANAKRDTELAWSRLHASSAPRPPVNPPHADAARAPAALRRLIGLRYAVAALVAVSVLGLHFAFAVPVRWSPVAAAFVALLLVNAVLQWRIARRRTVSESGLFANFGFEVAALTALLSVVGGATNPLVSLYLLPITMAAYLLTRRHTWTLAALTAACYSLLFIVGDPGAEHVHGGEDQAREFSTHLVGMWAVFLVSAALVAHYVSSLAEAVRDRDRKLALAREEALRNERVVALGTLGAGAAHELGTPLSTIGVLAEDMARRYGDHPEIASDVAVLQDEVVRCKGILNALTAAAGSMRGEGGTAESADVFLARTVDRWQLLQPAVRAGVAWSGAAAPALLADQTLEQALLNLLNNAADASPSGFDVVGHCDAAEIVIDILDRGPGLTDEVEQRAGELFFSTKAPEGGMGIGLFLANATIERFGGQVSLFNRAGGGCCTRVTLPSVLAASGANAK